MWTAAQGDIEIYCPGVSHIARGPRLKAVCLPCVYLVRLHKDSVVLKSARSACSAGRQ